MRLVRAILALLLAALPLEAGAQQSILQGGASTAGHVPIYATGGTGQTIVFDSGPAGGNTTGQGLSELNITSQCAAPPCASSGTGQGSTHFQIQDAVSTNATGYHFLSFDANAGGGGLITYGAAGAASSLPLAFKVNGTSYSFPFAVGGIVGPGTTVVNDVACWNNTVGTLLKDCGPPLAVGGTPGQVQYNNAGALGGFTVSGDGTLNTSTGALAVTKIGGVAVSLGGAFTTGAAITLNTGGVTSVTLPVSGTLATLAGSESLTNKTYNGNIWTAGTGTLTIAAGKTLTASNTLTFSGTDASTLNIGTGGTLGTAAFTASSAYMPANVQVVNVLGSDQPLSNTGTFFPGPTVAQGATGTWYACGNVTLQDTAGAAQFNVKLWDGTTVISSGQTFTTGTNSTTAVTLCGWLVTPASNIRMSVMDVTSTSGKILANQSSGGKDSTVSAFRVN